MTDVLPEHTPRLLAEDQIDDIHDRHWRQWDDRTHGEQLAWIHDFPDGYMTDADAILNHIHAQDEIINQLRTELEGRTA